MIQLVCDICDRSTQAEASTDSYENVRCWVTLPKGWAGRYDTIGRYEHACPRCIAREQKPVTK